jgi:hypothetical protein
MTRKNEYPVSIISEVTQKIQTLQNSADFYRKFHQRNVDYKYDEKNEQFNRPLALNKKIV